MLHDLVSQKVSQMSQMSQMSLFCWAKWWAV